MIPDSTQDAKKPVRSSVLAKPRPARSRDERGRKRKKPDNKKQSTKKQKEAKSAKKDEDHCPSDSSQMDLSIELKPIGGYLNDRLLMLEQMFHSLREKKVRAMLPEILKDMDIDELKRLCVEQLEVMSKKRIRSILAGADPDEISSSGTEDEDEEEAEDQESVQPADSTSSAFMKGELLPDQVELNADANEVDSLYDDNLDKPKGKNAIRRADEEAKKRMQASAVKRKQDPGSLLSEDNDINENMNDGNKVEEETEQEINVEDEEVHKESDEEKEAAAAEEEEAEEEDRAPNNASLEDIALTSFTKNQMEILELEMRARAIKSMLTAQMVLSAGDDDDNDDECLESDDSDDSLVRATYKIYPPLTESPKLARQLLEKHSDSETEEGEVITDSEEELENNITVLSSKLDVPADICMDSYRLLNDLSVKVANLIEENVREDSKNDAEGNVIASSLDSGMRTVQLAETDETRQQDQEEKALEDKNSIPQSHQQMNTSELFEVVEASDATAAVPGDPVPSKEETMSQSLEESVSEHKQQDTTVGLGKTASPDEQKASSETVISEAMNENAETATVVNTEEFEASDSPKSLDYNFDDEIEMQEVDSSDESESTDPEQMSENMDDNEDFDGLEEEVRKSYRADMAEAERQRFGLDNVVEAELELNENDEIDEQLQESNIGNVVASEPAEEKFKEDDEEGDNLDSDLLGHISENVVANSDVQVVEKKDEINVANESVQDVRTALEYNSANNENLCKVDANEVDLKPGNIPGTMSAEEDQASRSSTSSKTESINETANESDS